MVSGNASVPVSGSAAPDSQLPPSVVTANTAFSSEYDSFADNYSRGAPQPQSASLTSSQQAATAAAAQQRLFSMMTAYQNSQSQQTPSAQQQQRPAPPAMAALQAAVMDVGQRNSEPVYPVSDDLFATATHFHVWQTLK